MSAPHAVLAKLLPVEEHRRVIVDGQGPGTLKGHLTLGGVLTGYEIKLDSGTWTGVAPNQVTIITDETGAPNNVVQLRQPHRRPAADAAS